MVPRKQALYKQALREAASSLAPVLEELGGKPLPDYQVRKITQDTIRAYMMVARDLENSRIDGRISPESRMIAALEVGGTLLVEAQPFQSLRSRMSTARQLMGNDDAKWKCETAEHGMVRITRTVDGSRWWRDPTKNVKAVELASLAPGKSKIAISIVTTRGEGQMGTNTKIAARKILNDPHADWTVRMSKASPGRVLLTRIR